MLKKLGAWLLRKKIVKLEVNCKVPDWSLKTLNENQEVFIKSQLARSLADNIIDNSSVFESWKDEENLVTVFSAKITILK